jgi:hypothetical protein
MRTITGTLTLVRRVLPEDGVADVGTGAVIRPGESGSLPHQQAADGRCHQHLEHLAARHRFGQTARHLVEAFIFHLGYSSVL